MNTNPENWSDVEIDTFLKNHFHEYDESDQKVILSLGITSTLADREKNISEMNEYDEKRPAAIPA